jgi:PKHD-type hydroxylase|tara:strand:- start:112 stop:744 length:633 start_codon:yes stop_codon:yes gene_type:complete
MNTANYWYFKSALTPKFCDDVIKYGLSKSEEMAKTGNTNKDKLSKEEIRDIRRIRNSNIVWLDDPWIYREIHPYIHKANENAGWNFDWDFSESCQFTKYKLNQFYDWHCDCYSKPYDDSNNKNLHGKIRKLSVTCQLTDGSEYEGGELEFDFRNYDPSKRDESKHLVKAKEILPKGSIVVFPSHVWHRVKPVQKGTRYSLVLWNLGYPFK